MIFSLAQMSSDFARHVQSRWDLGAPTCRRGDALGVAAEESEREARRWRGLSAGAPAAPVGQPLQLGYRHRNRRLRVSRTIGIFQSALQWRTRSDLPGRDPG